MKHLLIDVGNTNAKFCVVHDEVFYEIDVSQALAQLTEFESVALASVADNENVNLVLAKAKSLGKPIVTAEVDAESFGIQCAYKNYQNLGIDRWLAVVAAEAELPNQDVVIVDAGTAMTVDFLTAEKKHLGGWIVPGLDLMKTSIIDKAPKVFGDKKVEFELFGTDTPSAVFNGCLLTCVGSIHLAMQQLHEKTASPVKLLLTGGNSKQLADLINGEKIQDEFLIFKGLKRFLTEI